MKESKFYTAKDIEQLISNRFCAPEYAFIPQVRNGTGYLNTIRTADAIAMGLWPSRGLYLNGFEIKVNRGDWLSELKNPAKADEIAQFCDFWWVVAPKDIIKVEEVPALWGLMIPFGATTKILKPAQLLKSNDPDKLFLAAILRRAQETITPEAELKESFNKGKIKGEENAQIHFKYERDEHNRLKQAVDDFEKASGVKINEWRGAERIGEAVRMVLEGEHLRAKEELKRLLKQAEEIVEDIKNKLFNPSTK